MVKRRGYNAEDLEETIENKRLKKRYIVFEGIRGSGKSAMIFKTKEWLESMNNKVYTVEEPSRKILEITRTYGVDDKIDTLLFVADRLIQQKYLKKLPEDTIILAERCFLSTFAYQSSELIGTLYNLHDIDYGAVDENSDDWDNANREDIENIVLTSDTFIFPTAVIILDVPVGVGMRRKTSNLNKWETTKFLKGIMKKFQQMTTDKKYPFEICLIDSNREINETFKDVQNKISEVLKIKSYDSQNIA